VQQKLIAYAAQMEADVLGSDLKSWIKAF
jgi:hypothetical protein